MTAPERASDAARRIAAGVRDAGGTAYYVGGFVRDRLMGVRGEGGSPDIDIEVHGVEPAVLRDILAGVGKVLTVGESFGIYTLSGLGIDVALPRRENCFGGGHRDFEISVDPFIGTEKAAERRDFTVNAMMENILTGEIIDHFGGRDDLRNGIIRHVSGRTFAEDPLRVLRGAQFAARFGFAVDGGTLELCRGMDLTGLSCERVDGELRKAMLRADSPSVFFGVLRDCSQLGFWFPEAEALIGTPQDPLFHKEGDVWVHTMMVLDRAAERRGRASNPYGFMLAALCHDFGKPSTTSTVNGRIHSYGHDTAGVGVAGTFMRRLTSDKKLTEYVLNMVLLHMQPNVMSAGRSSVKATNRLFDRSVDPYGLIQLAVADSLGMIFDRTYYPSEPFLEERYGIFKETMAAPYVTGQDLIDAGLVPDSGFREILEYAHKLRLACVDRDSALKQTLAYASRLGRKRPADGARSGGQVPEKKTLKED